MISDKEDEDDDSEDDLILLSGLDCVTKWRFPQAIKYCPLPNCLLLFGVRSDAITHFRKKVCEQLLQQYCTIYIGGMTLSLALFSYYLFLAYIGYDLLCHLQKPDTHR